jgi:hypothetical protein
MKKLLFILTISLLFTSCEKYGDEPAKLIIVASTSMSYNVVVDGNYDDYPSLESNFWTRTTHGGETLVNVPPGKNKFTITNVLGVKQETTMKMYGGYTYLLVITEYELKWNQL